MPAARERAICTDGRGYSYARTLPAPPVYRACPKAYADALLRDQLRRRLDVGYFNLILVTTYSNRCCAVGKCCSVAGIWTLVLRC